MAHLRLTRYGSTVRAQLFVGRFLWLLRLEDRPKIVSPLKRKGHADDPIERTAHESVPLVVIRVAAKILMGFNNPIIRRINQSHLPRRCVQNAFDVGK